MADFNLPIGTSINDRFKNIKKDYKNENKIKKLPNYNK